MIVIIVVLNYIINSVVVFIVELNLLSRMSSLWLIAVLAEMIAYSSMEETNSSANSAKGAMASATA